MEPDIDRVLSIAFQDLIDLPSAGKWRRRAVDGGSIHQSFELITHDDRRWFCKVSDAREFPGMIASEAAGLRLLAANGPVRLPAVLACTEEGSTQLLLLEWIAPGPRPDTAAAKRRHDVLGRFLPVPATGTASRAWRREWPASPGGMETCGRGISSAIDIAHRS